MAKIEIRPQRVSDARRFYDILTNPNFIYFTAPKSVEAEKEFIKKGKVDSKNNHSHNFSIIYDGKLVGGCGIKVDQHRLYIGEAGYFVDEKYWGKGIATKALRLLEKLGFERLGLSRITILMETKHKASEKVAIKSGYKKEGKLTGGHEFKGKLVDCYLYAKVKR